MFKHALIPEGYRHAHVPEASFKRLRAGDAAGESSQPTSQWETPLALDASTLERLYNWLKESWDACRECNEPGAKKFAAPSIVRSVRVMDDRFQAVTLGNNRFCLCKSASHKSNSIYLVLDLVYRTYHQKCFDPDCKHYRGPPFELSPEFFDEKKEEVQHKAAADDADFKRLKVAVPDVGG